MTDTNRTQATTQSYYYGPVVSTFKTVNQQWDKPLGVMVSKTAVWRWVCIISVIVSLLLSLYLLMLVNMPKHRVWAVAMTPNGFVVDVGLLTETTAFPSNKGEKYGTQ